MLIQQVRKMIKDYIKNRSILKLLVELKDKGEVFNKMVGSLYSGICADEINKILDELKFKYNVGVSYYQYAPGRIEFGNLDELIEKYIDLL